MDLSGGYAFGDSFIPQRIDLAVTDTADFLSSRVSSAKQSQIALKIF